MADRTEYREGWAIVETYTGAEYIGYCECLRLDGTEIEIRSMSDQSSYISINAASIKKICYFASKADLLEVLRKLRNR